MRYECVNCKYCCVTTSSSVSYCGLANECMQDTLETGLVLSFCFLCLALFAFFLALLYFRFRKRDFGIAEQPPIKIQSERIEPQSQPEAKSRPSPERKEQKPQKDKKARKNKVGKYSKFSTPSTLPDTERGLR